MKLFNTTHISKLFLLARCQENRYIVIVKSGINTFVITYNMYK